MLSGVQEILVIVAILMAIIFLPRIAGRNRPQSTKRSRPLFSRIHLSGRRRLALLATLLWPLGMALYLEPWRSSLIPFLSYGLGPVLLCWGVWWVMVGFLEKRNK
jgi:hypothetical protein